jgi:hypothetical protein
MDKCGKESVRCLLQSKGEITEHHFRIPTLETTGFHYAAEERIYSCFEHNQYDKLGSNNQTQKCMMLTAE